MPRHGRYNLMMLLFFAGFLESSFGARRSSVCLLHVISRLSQRFRVRFLTTRVPSLGLLWWGFADDDLPLIRFDFMFSVSGKRQDCTLVPALTADVLGAKLIVDITVPRF